MPVRSVRVHVYNESSYLTMQRTALQSCSGAWTDGWAPPPTSIAPGKDSLFQAESDGVATGAIGYIKLDLVAADGKHGMVYLYWDNPYLGVTNFKIKTDKQDVTVDCGPGPTDTSSFSESGPVDFSIAYGSGDLDGDDAMNDSPLQTLGNVAAVPLGGAVDPGVGTIGGALVALFGQEHIMAHAWVEMHVRDQEQPGLASTPPVQYAFSYRSNVVPNDWIGHWNGNSVDVQVSSKSTTMVTVKVTDATTKPPFSVSEDVDLVQFQVPEKTDETLAKGVGVVKLAGAGTPTPAAEASSKATGLNATGLLEKTTTAAKAAAVTDKLIVATDAHSGATPLKANRYKDAILLGDGVSLTLMNVKANGQPDGTSVRYQRHTKTPPVSMDAELLRYVPPPR
jgi:hypothetical protein